MTATYRWSQPAPPRERRHRGGFRRCHLCHSMACPECASDVLLIARVDNTDASNLQEPCEPENSEIPARAENSSFHQSSGHGTQDKIRSFDDASHARRVVGTIRSLMAYLKQRAEVLLS